MKVITSTLFAVVFASFASVSMADNITATGFSASDSVNKVCTYGKRADRKRDLNCVH